MIWMQQDPMESTCGIRAQHKKVYISQHTQTEQNWGFIMDQNENRSKWHFWFNDYKQKDKK